MFMPVCVGRVLVTLLRLDPGAFGGAYQPVYGGTAQVPVGTASVKLVAEATEGRQYDRRDTKGVLGTSKNKITRPCLARLTEWLPLWAAAGYGSKRPQHSMRKSADDNK